MLNATVGVHRILARLRPDQTTDRPAPAAALPSRSLIAARRIRHRLFALAMTLRLASHHAAEPVHRTFSQAVPSRTSAHRIRYGAHRPAIGAHRRSIVDRVAAVPAFARRSVNHLPAVAGHERLLPIGVGVVLVAAAVFSVNNVGAARGGIAQPEATPRIAIAGLETNDAALQRHYDREIAEFEAAQVNGADVAALGDVGDDPGSIEALLWKPVVVDTTVSDGKDRLMRYRVRPGDTLTGIANRFNVSMMTVWWANDLKRKDDLKVGQSLIIPPTSGLVVTVSEGDTLDAIARRNKVTKDMIYEYNGLEDEVLIAGQVLIVPGARGQAIPIPKVVSRPRTTVSSSGGVRHHVIGTPTRYSGGPLLWPLPGGRIVQYFHYGHEALDISGDYGDTVRAAASGTVTFAGWKNNGGGYQVWISHGSGLYTTYNHMSNVSVGFGAHVSRGQRVGHVGCTGWCTGPHLHFEVWRGPIWDGGVRVNPLKYL